MRAACISTLLTLCSACGAGGPPYFIQGSARLPQCSEAPAENLSARWFSSGSVEILTAGCADTTVGEQLTMCGLGWTLSQDGNAVEILVDNEYQIRGRFCGSQLHLQGGWWLPVPDDDAGCTYEDDTGSEVAIQSPASHLTMREGALVGELSVRAECDARVTLRLTRAGG